MYEKIIEQCTLFQGVSSNYQEQFMAKHQIKTVTAGARIVQQGEDGDGMYIVLSGLVEVVVSQGDTEEPEKVVKTLETGDYFGEICMIKAMTRTASVIAKTETKLMLIKRDEFQHAIEQRDLNALIIVYNIANILVKHLKDSNELVAKLATEVCPSSELLSMRDTLLAIDIL